jgi:hypothetical protein
MDFFIQQFDMVLLFSLVIILWIVLLYRATGRNRSTDKLRWYFLFVLFLGWIYHLGLFYVVDNPFGKGENQWSSLISIFLFSLQYSLEMFLANTIRFKTEVANHLKDGHILVQLFPFIYSMAILTSGFAIFHFLSRRFYNRLWLTFHSSKKKTHIFIGVNEASLCLANDIASDKPDEQVVFVDFPSQQDNPQGISVWDIIARFFKDRKDSRELNDFVVLKAGKGIRKIVNWLQKETNSVYLLSDNQGLNVSNLEALWEYKDEFKCKIYCHAKKEGLINRYDNIADVEDRVVFVDSSYLAVESLKKPNSADLLPVNYVDIAEDLETKQRLGYVNSAFNCAIIGFGETGKESLKFLYEYASFPNKKNGKAPFKCHIFDDNLTKELGEFGIDLTTLRCPESMTPEFELHQSRVGTIKFREELSRLIKELNYIVVCLGNDDLNIETALDLAEWAVIEGRDTNDKFCIAIRQTRTSKLNQETLDKANKAYNGCIHKFGLTEGIWRLEIINNSGLDNDAREFYESYKKLSDIMNAKMGWDKDPTWEEREGEAGIRSEDYKTRCSARRKKMQDYSNCLHKMTKRALCEPYDKLAVWVLDVNEDANHCLEGNTMVEEVLEHLAVCEHLRWEASHLLMGYKPTNGKTDDLKKLHNCIKPYKELDEVIKHYDWLVVKNSLLQS